MSTTPTLQPAMSFSVVTMTIPAANTLSKSPDHSAALPHRFAFSNLDGLPSKGDVSDWCNSGHTAEELRGLLAAAPAWEPERPFSPLSSAGRPFPVECLPQPIRSFTVEAAAAIDCDASYVALPLLVALGVGDRHDPSHPVETRLDRAGSPVDSHRRR